MMQAALVWVRETHGFACLPSGFQSMEWYRALPAGGEYLLSLRVTSSSATAVTADCTMHDQAGTASNPYPNPNPNPNDQAGTVYNPNPNPNPNQAGTVYNPNPNPNQAGTVYNPSTNPNPNQAGTVYNPNTNPNPNQAGTAYMLGRGLNVVINKTLKYGSGAAAPQPTAGATATNAMATKTAQPKGSKLTAEIDYQRAQAKKYAATGKPLLWDFDDLLTYAEGP